MGKLRVADRIRGWRDGKYQFSRSKRAPQHRSFPDPSTATGGYEERLHAFRNVRDEIRVRIENELAGV